MKVPCQHILSPLIVIEAWAGAFGLEWDNENKAGLPRGLLGVSVVQAMLVTDIRAVWPGGGRRSEALPVERRPHSPQASQAPGPTGCHQLWHRRQPGSCLRLRLPQLLAGRTQATSLAQAWPTADSVHPKEV